MGTSECPPCGHPTSNDGLCNRCRALQSRGFFASIGNASNNVDAIDGKLSNQEMAETARNITHLDLCVLSILYKEDSQPLAIKRELRNNYDQTVSLDRVSKHLEDLVELGVVVECGSEDQTEYTITETGRSFARTVLKSMAKSLFEDGCSDRVVSGGDH